MKHLIILQIILFQLHINMHAIDIYLFPGQGADERLFKEIQFPEDAKVHKLDLHTPKRGESLKEYAYSFIPQIDTSKKFILIGVSMGGMICSELTDTLKPTKTIIISSAKCRDELPFRYRFQKTIPLNKLIPGWLTKLGARFLQPLVEPDSKTQKETFSVMLGSKTSKYMRRTVDMIVNWEKQNYDPNIIHIHGTEDHTLPIENVKAQYIVEGGSHMMVLTQAQKINPILHEILKKKEKPQ